VLNNRFIKVFWKSKDLQQAHEQTFGPKVEGTDDSDANSRASIKDRLGPKVSETESVLTAVNSSGTISRTVFDPSKLKKNNTTNAQKEGNNTSDTNSMAKGKPFPAPVTARSPSKERANKAQKQSIFTKQHKLLEELITNQKQLMSKLEKSTNETEKTAIKETIDGIGNKIQLISDSMKKVMTDKRSAKKAQTKEELMEEILNTDLDMFIKMQNNDLSYVELANKYAKLKKREKTLSVRGRGGARGARSRGRGGLYRRGSGGFGSRGGNQLMKVDRRTRKLLIPDINEDDMTDLLEHLAVSVA
jgi:hypothetical protein